MACQNSTRDGGEWISLNAQLPTHVPVTALALHPLAPETIFAGTYDRAGMYSTRDIREGWQPDRTGLAAAPVYALLARERELFAGTAAGLYRRAWNADYWQRADPVPEVAVNALAGNAGGEILAATDGRGMWTSGDEGTTWSRLPGLDDEPLLSILPLDAQTIFVGTAGHGLFVTRNRGADWESVPQFESAYVALVAPDPRDANTLFVGPRGGLERSRDAGRTWEALGGGIEKEIVTALRVHPGRGKIFAGTAGRGLLFSDNDGATWQEVKNSDGLNVFPRGRAVLTIVARNNSIFVGTEDGVFYSEDVGLVWNRIDSENKLGVPALRDLEFHADALWIATDDGLYRQTRGIERVAALQIAAPISAIASAPSSAHRIYAGTDGKGVFVSDDGGATWNAATGELGGKTRVAQLAVDPTNPEIVFARLLFERLYKSTDGGDSWRAIWTGMPVEEQLQTFAIAPNNPRILYAGGDTQLFYSDDGGETWQSRGLQGISTLALWIDAQDANHVWAGATDGLYVSADAGKTWRGPLLEGKTVSAVARDARGNFYVGTKYNGLFRADASANQFTRAGQGLETASVNELALDERRGVLYALTDAGLFCAVVDIEEFNPNPYRDNC